jgi:hypothetical protein
VEKAYDLNIKHPACDRDDDDDDDDDNAHEYRERRDNVCDT